MRGYSQGLTWNITILSALNLILLFLKKSFLSALDENFLSCVSLLALSLGGFLAAEFAANNLTRQMNYIW